MRPLPEIRTSNNNHTNNKGLVNVNGDTPEGKLSPGATTTAPTSSNSASGSTSVSTSATATSGTGNCNGVDRRPRIVTRSKTGKVLRSGRRALLQNSPTAPNHVNGYVKSLKIKNRALNGISSPGKHQHHPQTRSSLDGRDRDRADRRTRTPQNRLTSGSPGKIRSSSTSSAYAKHYKSYRRNSSTTRRNLMLSRSPSAQKSASSTRTPTTSTSTPSPTRKGNQRSLKKLFKSTTPTSGRLRLRPSDLRGTSTSTRTSPGSKVNQVLIRKQQQQQQPKSPIPSSSLTNGSHYGHIKSRSASASSTCSTTNSSPTSTSRHSAKDKEKDKVHRKSRSALWVLNCEAEEFLFGETAADKHELELPSKGRPRHSSSNSNSSSTTSTNHTHQDGDSPPPKKRRRWRETELSHLLETSPFLESKLRSNSSNPSSAQSSPGDESSHSNSSANGGRLQNHLKKVKVNVKLNFDREQRKQKYKNGPSSSPESSSPQRSRKNGKIPITKSMKTFRRRFEEIKKELEGKAGNGSTSRSKGVSEEDKEQGVVPDDNLYDVGPSSFINFNCELLSPRSNNSVDKALLLRETLEQVKWSFSFENPPRDESWYTTFSRGTDFMLSYKSFLLPSTISGHSPPLILPYQLDKSTLLRKTRKKKLPKNSRKSPRCHASTLAILSSPDSPPTLLTPGLVTSSTSIPSPSSPPPPPPRPHPHPPKSSHPHPHLPPISALHSSAPSDASLEALLISTSSGPTPPHQLPMLSPFTKFVAENSVRITRKRNSSAYQDPYQLYQRTQQGSGGGSGTTSGRGSAAAAAQALAKHSAAGQEELISAQQYLWDSIQFLSDPYVVSLLAGDEHLPITPSHSPGGGSSNSNSNKCSTSNQSSISTRTRHASTKSGGGGGSGRVPPPKTSPNKSSSTNGGGGVVVAVAPGKNGVIMAVPHPLRSPPPPHTRSAVKPPSSSPTNSCKSTSTPVVVMADICKPRGRKKSGTTSSTSMSTKGGGGGGGGGLVLGQGDEDDLLFVGEGLPPLPLIW